MTATGRAKPRGADFRPFGESFAGASSLLNCRGCFKNLFFGMGIRHSHPSQAPCHPAPIQAKAFDQRM
jgi:hypothetical protein